MNNEILELAQAADALLRHIRIAPAGRWPCVECGRAGPNEPLRVIASMLDAGRGQHAPIAGTGPITRGCWPCIAHNQIERLHAAVKASAGAAQSISRIAASRHTQLFYDVTVAPGQMCDERVEMTPSGTLCPTHGGGVPTYREVREVWQSSGREDTAPPNVWGTEPDGGIAESAGALAGALNRAEMIAVLELAADAAGGPVAFAFERAAQALRDGECAE